MNSLPTNNYSDKNEVTLRELIKEYSQFKEPIGVSFRKIVNWLPNQERATHLIHSYPAKLLMHIPHFFLSNNLLSNIGDTVLDPFCGSGTVLLESILSGRNTIGSDCNPLARLISEVKTKRIDINHFNIKPEELKNIIPTKAGIDPPEVVNIEYWFLPHIIQQLTRILEAIETIQDDNEKNFYLVCFSNCIRKVSLTDPYISVPVKLRIDKYPQGHKRRLKTEEIFEKLSSINVIEEFFIIVNSNIKRFYSLNELQPINFQSHVVCSDARNLKFEFSKDKKKSKIPNECIDLVITSPPYVGAQKYIRSCSLNLGWLRLGLGRELKTLENSTIGREHYLHKEYTSFRVIDIKEADLLLEQIYDINPLRAHIASNYLAEMQASFLEIVRVMKIGSYLVLVAANNNVCGYEFKTKDYLKKILEELGLELKLELIDDIRSRGLMTKRNKTASVITREWVLLFKK